MKICMADTTEVDNVAGKSLPALELMSGARNKFTVSAQSDPTALPKFQTEDKLLQLSIRGLIDQSLVIATMADIDLNSEVEIDVSTVIPSDLFRGYYSLHGVIKDADSVVTRILTSYVVVSKAAIPQPDNFLRLEVIRGALGDIFAEDNELLEKLEFGTGDIVSAVERCILAWNSKPPFTSTYEGYTFPYTNILLDGVCFELLNTATTKIGKNKLAYQGDGLTVDLEQRLEIYVKKALEYRMTWNTGMNNVKRNEDLMQFSGSLRYSYA